MSAAKKGADAITAFEKDKFEEAIKKLNEALKTNPKQPTWLLTLCQACLKIKPTQLEAALENAERAYVAASLRGDRKLMIHAMHFRAVSFHRLKRFVDSNRCCQWAIDLAHGNPAASEECTASKGPFKPEYTREGDRAKTFQTYVLSSLKEQAENSPEIPLPKSKVTKMPVVTWDVEEGEVEEGKVEEGEVKIDCDDSFEPKMETLSESQTVEYMAKKLRDGISKKSPGDIASWQKFYSQSKEENSDQAALSELEQANEDYWSNNHPDGAIIQKDTAITVVIYAKGADQHLQDSPFPLEIQLAPTKIVLYNLPIYGKSGRAVVVRPFNPIQPFQSSWKVSRYKIEINLVSDSPHQWNQQPSLSTVKVDTVSLGKVDVAAKSKDDVACIQTPLKTNSVVQHPTPKWIDLGSYHSNGANTSSYSTNSTAASTHTKDPPEKAILQASILKKPQGVEHSKPTQPMSPPKAPAYPTSSKKGPKDWDKIEDVGDDEDDADKHNPDHFFKMLYQRSTPEQKRAMTKSFVESNGTSLSTDWNDVSSRTMSTNPPDGVEAKKWE